MGFNIFPSPPSTRFWSITPGIYLALVLLLSAWLPPYIRIASHGRRAFLDFYSCLCAPPSISGVCMASLLGLPVYVHFSRPDDLLLVASAIGVRITSNFRFLHGLHTFTSLNVARGLLSSLRDSSSWPFPRKFSTPSQAQRTVLYYGQPHKRASTVRASQQCGAEASKAPKILS